MKHCNLRIAWSVAWGIVAVLLCVLWVRSYWWEDEINLGSISFLTGFFSAHGQLGCANLQRHVDFGLVCSPNERIVGGQFYWFISAGNFWAGMPHWFAILLAAGCAAVPCTRRRFSLRTLLIATTLVAVGLGLIVWAAGAR